MNAIRILPFYADAPAAMHDRIQRCEHDLTLAALQAEVNGYICPAFTVPSPVRKGVSITGYVNDEGLLLNMPLAMVRQHPMGIDPLVGPVIIVGLDEHDGETIGLTDDEITAVLDRLDMAVLRRTDEAEIESFIPYPVFNLMHFTPEADA